MMKKRWDVTIADVTGAYAGPVGEIWEMVMGEEIHVGGGRSTDELAQRAGVTADVHVLDICSALGGPARHLARTYGCRVTGLDATPEMVAEAEKRTEMEGLSGRVAFQCGNALDIPFRASTFDIVWGQDAWCYVTDKERLIFEAARVSRPGGVIAFTDWIQTGAMSDREWEALVSFMIFPSLGTLEGYAELLRENGFLVSAADDLSRDFADHCRAYREALEGDLQVPIMNRFGPDLYQAVVRGVTLWADAADAGKVGRGLWIGRRREI
jgi:ubiquinone/menaquinone biosynthesis C-methylase UbiE